MEKNMGMKPLFKEDAKRGEKSIAYKRRKRLVMCSGLGVMFGLLFFIQLFRRDEIRFDVMLVTMGGLCAFYSVASVYALIRRPSRRECFEAWVSEPGKCGRCGYDIRYGHVKKCPECGWVVPEGDAIDGIYLDWRDDAKRELRNTCWGLFANVVLCSVLIVLAGYYEEFVDFAWIMSVALGVVVVVFGVKAVRMKMFIRKQAMAEKDGANK